MHYISFNPKNEFEQWFAVSVGLENGRCLVLESSGLWVEAEHVRYLFGFTFLYFLWKDCVLGVDCLWQCRGPSSSSWLCSCSFLSRKVSLPHSEWTCKQFSQFFCGRWRVKLDKYQVEKGLSDGQVESVCKYISSSGLILECMTGDDEMCGPTCGYILNPSVALMQAHSFHGAASWFSCFFFCKAHKNKSCWGMLWEQAQICGLLWCVGRSCSNPLQYRNREVMYVGCKSLLA